MVEACPRKIYTRIRKFMRQNLIPFGLIVLTALGIGLVGVSTTGTLWPDGPRYANAGAMIRDWLLSGDWSHPYRFAIANYCQYPSFSIPYHPPVYPGLLGVWFVFTGVSYLAARCFTAIVLGLSGCSFFALLQKLGVERRGALGCSLLMLTTLPIVQWTRDTMSEVPGLCLILSASYAFLLWLDEGRSRHCWLAFALAEAAFLSRIATVGILPALFGFALLTGRGRRLLSRELIALSCMYLAINACYVCIVARFAQFEVGADGKMDGLSSNNLLYFTTCLPPALVGGTTLAALYGLFCLSRRRPILEPAALFWFSWLASYTLFKLVVPTSMEVRHFFMAFPSLAGLASIPFLGGNSGRLRPSRMAWLAVAAGLAINLADVSHLPRGIVGYEAVARRLASFDRPGNILLNCWHDQDLIFRYRAFVDGGRRSLIRGDRTLAVRLPDYAHQSATILAHSAEDVLATIRMGRVRYLVTCVPGENRPDDRPFEMALAHDVAAGDAARFRRIDRFPVTINFERDATKGGVVYVWEFLGDLPDGPSELPVRIPTAGLSLNRAEAR